jgi:DNA-binding MarR family transcriptional regulator
MDLPRTSARERPENLAILLREPFRRMTDLLVERLAERGHGDVRAAHGAVFQFLDDDGTSVSELARRAQIAKQSMAELVGHLERTGHVERVPDPADGRARQLHLTARGRAALATARRFHASFERRLAGEHGPDRVATVRAVLAGYLDQAGAETELARSLRPL